MKKIGISMLLLFFTPFIFGQDFLKIDSNGIQLRQFYLNQNVENLWIAGHHIDWETGIPDQPNATKGIKTHCSSFVASVCKQKGVYILRPPEHNTGLLANAQYDWLFSNDASKKGWHQIKDSIYVTSQRLANSGYLVVAVYKNPDSHKPGHIALVIPFEKSVTDLFQEGPTMIQAGQLNKNFISLKQGFRHHISDWELATHSIQFFFNENRMSAIKK